MFSPKMACLRVQSTLPLSPPTDSSTAVNCQLHVGQTLPRQSAAMPEVSGVTAAENKWIVVTGAPPLMRELYMLQCYLLSIMTP